MGKILLEDGPDANRFRVSLDDYQGTSILNLRYWYKDRNTGEFKPTRKGISITSRNYLTFKSVAMNHDEEIMEHLNSVNGDLFGQQQHIKNAISAKDSAKTVGKISVISFEVLKPSNLMYQIDYFGYEANLILNKVHPFVKDNALEGWSEEQLKPISQLLLALDLAEKSNSDEGVASSDIILQQFFYDFFKNSGKYSAL